MTTDLEARVRRGLRAYADGVAVGAVDPIGAASDPVPDPAPGPDLAPDLPPSLAAIGPGRRRRVLVPALVAAAVLAVLAVPAVVPFAVGSPGSRAGAPGGDATLPSRFAPYSYLTGSVSRAPAGRAIAIYNQGYGVEFLDFPQPVVVGADADSYRIVDEADRRADPGAQGDPARMLLAPTGEAVAIGDDGARWGDLAVVDLADGTVARVPVSPGRGVLPLAWSPDGRTVAVLVGDGPSDGISGPPPHGDLALVDLDTGAVRRPAAVGTVVAAAYSSDGTELAVQSGLVVSVIGTTDDRLRRELTVPRGVVLAGAGAWSPGGALLALVPSRPSGDDDVSFLDATGTGQDAPAPVTGVSGVYGWSSPETLLVGRSSFYYEEQSVEEWHVMRREGRRLAEFDTADGNYAVWRLQLATGLLGDLTVREPGRVGRGPWPVWALLAAGIPTAFVLLTAAAAFLGWRRRRRTPATGPAAPPSRVTAARPRARHLVVPVLAAIAVLVVGMVLFLILLSLTSVPSGVPVVGGPTLPGTVAPVDGAVLPGARSPDGRWIATGPGLTAGATRTAFVEATDGERVPPPSGEGVAEFSGRRSPETIPVGGRDDSERSYGLGRIEEGDLVGVERRTPAGFDPVPGGNFGVIDFQLATGLPALGVREPGHADRGRRPIWP